MAAIVRAMSRGRPDNRFQTVDALIVDLEAFLKDLDLP